MHYNSVLWRGFADHGYIWEWLQKFSGRWGKPLDAEGIQTLVDLGVQKMYFDFLFVSKLLSWMWAYFWVAFSHAEDMTHIGNIVCDLRIDMCTL